MIFSAFGDAVTQLGDRRFIWVVLKSVMITMIALALTTLGIQWLIPDTLTLPWFGEVPWAGWILNRAVIVAMMAGSVFLMIPIASIVVGFFLEEVADAVEDVHYSQDQAKNPIGLWAGFVEGTQFLAILLLVNIAALIPYLIAAPFGLTPLVFVLVNGILLGREYAQLVAMRHVGRQGAKAFRARNRGTIWLAGVLMAIPLLVPVLNLVIPVLGVATYTHLFHRLQQTETFVTR
ncbi:MAG: EI24 domain-containing protein [Pseudomonadota bacterium]